jgi:acetolactate synthase-1/2/3 large subunit
MKIKVSELIVRYMERLGIDCIFGMPGAHILPVYDSLYDSKIQVVLAKHEQGAAFMACGFTRSSGRLGACIATAGPGATNLVTGVANAYADRQPMLAITGETPTHIFGRGGLQESSGEGGSIDQASLFRGITRYHKIVERTDYLPQVLNQTTKILRSANSGPVLLSLPFNIQNEEVDAHILDHIPTTYQVPRHYDGMPAIVAMCQQIERAEHPVIVAGYGCLAAQAQDEVARLSAMWNIPVTTSLKAKGVIDERSRLSLGTLGVTSSGHAFTYITEKADLILILGAGFNERTSYLWDPSLLQGKRIIQIDNDADQLEKVFTADIAFHGDVKEVLESLLHHFVRYLPDAARSKVTRQDIEDLKSQVEPGYAIFQSGFSLIERFFRRLAQRFPADAMIFDDNIIFAQNFLQVSSGNRYYPNSGISSLGHAIPAAIGARFAEDKPTFAILGDGGFQMCCMEIMTAVNYSKPLNIILFNNSTMGLIRKNQIQKYRHRLISCDFVNPDYRRLAESFGIHHWSVGSKEQMDLAFAEADWLGEINLFELLLDKDLFPNYSSRR